MNPEICPTETDSIVIDNYCFSVKHKPLKRLFDLLFSISALILGMPLYLLIAVGVKLTSNGPIFYSHTRVGRKGKLFKCYKFRTMCLDADAKQQQILEADALLFKEWKEARKLRMDPRVTVFGKFLRSTSLDELPQFWNVLKGDLSVVGPRPVVIDEVVQHYGLKAEKILSVRPGITGLWQVSGRSNINYSRRLQFDEQYVDEHSMLLDLKLIFKTIPSMINRNGAY